MISTGGIHRSAQSRMHVAWLSEGGGVVSVYKVQSCLKEKQSSEAPGWKEPGRCCDSRCLFYLCLQLH